MGTRQRERMVNGSSLADCENVWGYFFTASAAAGSGAEEENVINRPEYDAELIGRNLKRLRKAKKLTVEEVRQYLQLGSVQAVYKYEAGKSYPPSDAIFALMQLYEADLYDIVCGCERNPKVTPVEAAVKKQIGRFKKDLRCFRKYIVRKAA